MGKVSKKEIGGELLCGKRGKINPGERKNELGQLN